MPFVYVNTSCIFLLAVIIGEWTSSSVFLFHLNQITVRKTCFTLISSETWRLSRCISETECISWPGWYLHLRFLKQTFLNHSHALLIIGDICLIVQERPKMHFYLLGQSPCRGGVDNQRINDIRNKSIANHSPDVGCLNGCHLWPWTSEFFSQARRWRWNPYSLVGIIRHWQCLGHFVGRLLAMRDDHLALVHSRCSDPRVVIQYTRFIPLIQLVWSAFPIPHL